MILYNTLHSFSRAFVIVEVVLWSSAISSECLTLFRVMFRIVQVLEWTNQFIFFLRSVSPLQSKAHSGHFIRRVLCVPQFAIFHIHSTLYTYCDCALNSTWCTNHQPFHHAFVFLLSNSKIKNKNCVKCGWIQMIFLLGRKEDNQFGSSGQLQWTTRCWRWEMTFLFPVSLHRVSSSGFCADNKSNWIVSF